jgi:hypothetical protein
VETFLAHPETITNINDEDRNFLSAFLVQPPKRGLVSWQIPSEEKPRIFTTKLGKGGMGSISAGEFSQVFFFDPNPNILIFGVQGISEKNPLLSRK